MTSKWRAQPYKIRYSRFKIQDSRFDIQDSIFKIHDRKWRDASWDKGIPIDDFIHYMRRNEVVEGPSVLDPNVHRLGLFHRIAVHFEDIRIGDD